MSRYIDADAAAEELRALYGLTENDHEDYIVASAIEAIQALECQTWHSVADDLPATSDEVLCCSVVRGSRKIDKGIYVPDKHRWVTRWSARGKGKVTHWMPLPDEPEKEG